MFILRVDEDFEDYRRKVDSLVYRMNVADNKETTLFLGDKFFSLKDVGQDDGDIPEHYPYSANDLALVLYEVFQQTNRVEVVSLLEENDLSRTLKKPVEFFGTSSNLMEMLDLKYEDGYLTRDTILDPEMYH